MAKRKTIMKCEQAARNERWGGAEKNSLGILFEIVIAGKRHSFHSFREHIRGRLCRYVAIFCNVRASETQTHTARESLRRAWSACERNLSELTSSACPLFGEPLQQKTINDNACQWMRRADTVHRTVSALKMTGKWPKRDTNEKAHTEKMTMKSKQVMRAMGCVCILALARASQHLNCESQCYV